MLRHLVAWLSDTVRGLPCPYRCGYRGHDLAGHVDVDHCGDDHVQIDYTAADVHPRRPDLTGWA